MSKLETLRNKRNELIGKIEALKESNNVDGVSLEKRTENRKELQKMVAKLSEYNGSITIEEELDRAKTAREQEEEFSVRQRPGGGDLQFRRAGWNEGLDTDNHLPELEELRTRDSLIWQRYADFDSLSNDEKVASYRKYAGERLFLRWIAALCDNDQLRLSDDEMQQIYKFQDRAQANTAKIGADADGGYLVPTETEAAIVHEMAFVGPFAGPNAQAGRWVRYEDGIQRKINVNTSGRAARARYVDEATDITAQKPTWSQKTLSFTTLAMLMPWTIQVDQDSASNVEQELRWEMGKGFGRTLNDDLTQTYAGSVKDGSPSFLNAYTAAVLATQTITSSANTDKKIGPKEIIQLKYKVDKAYRGMDDWHFQASDAIMSAIEQEQDTQGRFLYQRPQDDGPLMVHGMRAVTNNGLDSPAAGKTVAACGGYNNFRIGYVRGMFIMVYKELFMQSLQLGLQCFYRCGSVVTDPRAFAKFNIKA